MQSTTASPLMIHPLRPAATPPPAPADRRLERGLDVLERLVTQVQRPADRREELDALAALRRLRSQEPLPPEAEMRRRELVRSLELLGEEEVRALLDWIKAPARWQFWLRKYRNHLAQRHTLLLLLLAKTVGLLDRSKALFLLNEFKIHGAGVELVDHMQWARRQVASGSFLRTAVAYLDLSREQLFAEDKPSPSFPAQALVDGFDELPWLERLLLLKSWRLSWDAGEDPLRRRPATREEPARDLPTCYGHRVEFRLARRGSFRRLSWAGGHVARHILRELAYRDRRASSRLPAKALLLLTVVLLLSYLAVVGIQSKLPAWDRSNAGFSSQVDSRFAPFGVPLENASGVQGTEEPAAPPLHETPTPSGRIGE